MVYDYPFMIAIHYYSTLHRIVDRSAIIFDKRICYGCDSNRTLFVNGRLRWLPNIDIITHEILHYMCSRCYDRIFVYPKFSHKYKANALKHCKEYDKKRIAYKGKKGRITLSFEPRKGKCSDCNRSIKHGHMHHNLGYFPIFPWFGTKELCGSCHNLYHPNIVKPGSRSCIKCSKTDEKSYRWRHFLDGFQCGKCYQKEWKIRRRLK